MMYIHDWVVKLNSFFRKIIKKKVAEREASALWWSKDIQLFWLPLKDAKKGFRSEESGKPTFRLPLNYVTLGLHISDWTYRVSMLRLLRHSFSAVGILKTRKDREYII